jgi:hypothetical protein
MADELKPTEEPTEVQEQNVAPVEETEAVEVVADDATEVSEATNETEETIEEVVAEASEVVAGAKYAVPEVANKSDYVEPGSWQAEAKEKGVSRTKATPANIIPSDKQISEEEEKLRAGYKETDIFAWSNNIVQYKDELKIDLFLFNKNFVVYRTARAPELDKQMEPMFLDGLLEFVLDGVEQGLIVRGFEQAEAETNVLQRTQTYKVDKLREVLGWLKTQEHEIELFIEEEHDMKRIKGVIARLTHKDMENPVYIIKALPQSQVMKGSSGWMLRNNKMVPFDADAALRIPTDNQLLVIDQDLYVFNQAKLKALFGYDAKESFIAEQKVREIEENFRLSFSDGATMQDLVKGKRPLIKKLQKLEPAKMNQEDIMDHSDEMGVGLMQDERGAIIIMDDKDLSRFVNLLNDDYMTSPITGIRYEVQKKRELKPADEEELLKQILPDAPAKPAED